MTKVYIIDDHNLVVEGILSLFQNEDEISVCGYAKTAQEALIFFENDLADVILMDINLPDMSGLDLCKLLKEKYPNVKILALSTFNQSSYISKMMANGASGYLLKNIAKEELMEAVKMVMGTESNFPLAAFTISSTSKL